MLMATSEFRSGDQVFHPRFGLGVIDAIQTRAPNPQENQDSGATTRYYQIRLSAKGMLYVPVARAEALGLRRLVNGLAPIVACLRSEANVLPWNARQRVMELRGRWDAPDPRVLPETLRDLLGFGRTYRLSAGDKQWLVRASERLSVEAAMVDSVELSEARQVIKREVDALKAQMLGARAPAP
jgi:RNA polymerase-interacting CarD/CdnL/TRCF family regulator